MARIGKRTAKYYCVPQRPGIHSDLHLKGALSAQRQARRAAGRPGSGSAERVQLKEEEEVDGEAAGVTPGEGAAHGLKRGVGGSCGDDMVPST